ncbi:MAG: transketolase family protein [Sphaerochaetaceae bacterium]|nr:transketolase family protein [Sphaerochaetaceae bacterium]
MDMREIYCNTLIEEAKTNDKIMVVEADLMRATGTAAFKDAYPNRFVNVGIAEANLIGVSAGLSNMGKIPFAATFACFASRRAFDQFFLSANYAKLNVKLVGTDPGVTAAFNGGTHMPFEDLALMQTIPNLTICEPCDAVSLKKTMKNLINHYGSTYMRLQRKGSQSIYSSDEEFEIGKGKVLKDGNDVTIVALGYVLVPEALKAAKMLEKEGISAAVIDPICVKPLDKELILHYASKTKHIVSAENHQVGGGLGSAISNLLALERPTKMRMVGIQDEFGQVGTLDFLKEYYKLTADEIYKQAKAVLNKE